VFTVAEQYRNSPLHHYPVSVSRRGDLIRQRLLIHQYYDLLHVCSTEG